MIVVTRSVLPPLLPPPPPIKWQWEDGTVLKPIEDGAEAQLIGGRIATEDTDDRNIMVRKSDNNDDDTDEKAGKAGGGDKKKKK